MRKRILAVALTLDSDGLPVDPTAAYQTIAKAEAINGIGTVEHSREFLRAMVAKGRGRLNGAHFFLASLLDSQQRGELYARRPFCKTIFTSNFDPYLQTSLQLIGVLYSMTDRPELRVDPGHLEESDEAVHLVYVHGSVHRPYLASTEQELRRLRDTNAPVFRAYLETHGVIVIGYSGWDDCIMKALQECTNFSSNLYWCDVFPAEDAPSRLSDQALRILNQFPGRAFYVPLGDQGADGFMGSLFQSLARRQGIPTLLLDPFVALHRRLLGVSLQGVMLTRFDRGGASHTLTDDLAVPAEELRSEALLALEGASVALRQTTGDGHHDEVSVVYLLRNALNRYFAGEAEEAIALWTSIAELPRATAADKAKALVNLAVASSQANKHDAAVGLLTRAVQLPGAPADQSRARLF